MVHLIDKDALVAEIERRIESCAKQREDMLNVQCHTLADDASARMGELNCIQDFINTLEVKEVQEEQCTETEFREIEILRTKLCDVAKAIYYHKGKENPTVERIREIVQDCCFELIDLKEPKQKNL